jgi:excinuclease ABC subunit C
MTRKQLVKLKLPDSPGVYFFKAGKTIIYIGKATSLRDRVRSYFSTTLGDARSSAIVAMTGEARSISWKETDSVLEALILEANLIKKHQPIYNSRDKDNKSFNYLVITKEDFPRVLVMRGRELFSPLSSVNHKQSIVFGPYPQGGSLKEALRVVRKIFPFRDKCIPCIRYIPEGSPRIIRGLPSGMGNSGMGNCKPCFNRQIGLCPGVCAGEISKIDYARTIRHIKTLFSGKINSLKKDLEREMRLEAKAEYYEKAEELRRQSHALNHIRDVSLIRRDVDSVGGISAVNGAGPAGTRIEAYDVAHTSGTETVAVMTVINNGEPEKESYRKFKIKTVGNDDVGALKEALSRRLAHTEWALPRVFVVDGGLAQLHAAIKLLTSFGILVPVVAVVKNEFHKPERMIGDTKSIESLGRIILLANQEAHRFAIAYHRKRMYAFR